MFSLHYTPLRDGLQLIFILHQDDILPDPPTCVNGRYGGARCQGSSDVSAFGAMA